MAALKSGLRQRNQQVEGVWRLRLEKALEAYRSATAEYERLLPRQPSGLSPEAESLLARARSAQADAFLEYSRLLGVFGDLVFHGKLPH